MVTCNSESQWTSAHGNLLLAVALEPKEIGQRIKAARVGRWTQLSLALEANVSPSTIARWERGELPPVRELMRLAAILEIPVERLVEDLPPGDQEELRVRLAIREEMAETRDLVARIAAHLGLDDARSA